MNIAAMMDMSSPAVSHHLRILRDSGLLTTRRDGKEVYYHAADTAQARLLHELIEQVMDVACPQWRAEAEQVRLIREIHDYLLSHMDQRITIENLCRLYPINPTTLKEVFKDVYGTSIAAHLKEHRMEKAARLLCETDASVAEVARRVGYEARANSPPPSRTSTAVCPQCIGRCHKRELEVSYRYKKGALRRLFAYIKVSPFVWVCSHFPDISCSHFLGL